MPILIACSCGKKLKVRDELAGKKVKCPACGGVLLAEEVYEAVEAEPAPSQPPPLAGKNRAAPAPAAAQPETDTAAYWECKREFTKGLLIVTDEALWFGKIADQDLKRAKKSLAAGDEPEDVLEDESTRWQLRYGDLQGINFNKRHAQMIAEFPGADEKETTTFHFDDHATRDEAFKELRRRLGKEWAYERRDLNRFQAMLAPLTVIGIMVLVFGFCVFLAWAFQQPSDGRPRVVRTSLWGIIIAYTVGWLGPIWTGAIGGVCVICAVAWMFVRMADPPIEITLKPKPGEPAKDDGADDDESEERRPTKPSRRRRDEDD